MEVAEQWRRQFSLGEPGENVTGSMAVLRARAPGARLSIVRTEWRSTGRTTATGTTSSTRTVRGMMRGSTTMTNNREPEKLSSPSLVSRKPLEISTTRLESDDDSSVEQKYQVSEPSDTETSEPTSWTRPESQSADNSSSNISTGYSRNSDLFNDIDNFIIKPSQLRKCSTISEESLNEVRNRIKSLVSNGSQSNTSDTSENQFRDDEFKVNPAVSRVKSFISKMESNSEEKYETNSIGSKTSTQNSYDDDVFKRGYSDKNSDKLSTSRSKPIDFSSESDLSISDHISEKPYRFNLNQKSPMANTENFQQWLSKNNKTTPSLFQLPKNNCEPVKKWDNNSIIREKVEDLDIDSKSSGKISISIPLTHEGGSGTARKKIIQHSLCEGTTVSIESSKPHSIVTNARDIFPQNAGRHLAISNYKAKDPWMDSNSLMSSSLSNTKTNQFYNEEFDENTEKKNKRVEFCKTEVHFAIESGQMQIVESDDKPPPTNNFRRRRKGSTFVPLAPVDRKITPVTLFGAATDPESYSYVDQGEDLFGSDCKRNETETRYAMDNSAQVYREEEYHTVTPMYEQDVIPRGILKNKTMKPLPYHLGAGYELGSLKRDDSVWGVKLKPVTDNLSSSPGIALLNKSLAQTDRFLNRNCENNNILNVNSANGSNERIVEVRNERLQNSSLSVYEHLEKLKQSERFKFNSSDAESEQSDIAIREKDSVVVTHQGYNVLSSDHVPVSKSPELKTVAQLAPMSPTKSRKLRANELTYFGIQPSPKPQRKEIKESYSELNKYNKPDIIEHTFVNHKSAARSKLEKSKVSKEPAERSSKRTISDEPIYTNISAERKFTPVAAPRSHSTKPEVTIEELNHAAGEISKIAEQYSNEASPWVSTINSECPLKTINETSKATKTTERKSSRIVKSTSDKSRPSQDKGSTCTVQRATDKKLPAVKSHRPQHSSSQDSSVVPIETVIVPPTRRNRTQTNETNPDSQARLDSRGKHRTTNTTAKQRSHYVIPVQLESDVEDHLIKTESKVNTRTRRENSSKDRKEKTLEKKRTGDQPKVIKPSMIHESGHRELRGKQLRTPTPSSQLASNSAENRTSLSRQRNDRDRHTKHRQGENQESSLKRNHESRMIRHPVKDGIISASHPKRDTSSRDRSEKKDSERVKERKEEGDHRETQRKKGTSSRQNPGKSVEKKKRLKVTLEIKNPLGPLMKQKNEGK